MLKLAPQMEAHCLPVLSGYSFVALICVVIHVICEQLFEELFVVCCGIIVQPMECRTSGQHTLQQA